MVRRVHAEKSKHYRPIQSSAVGAYAGNRLGELDRYWLTPNGPDVKPRRNCLP